MRAILKLILVAGVATLFGFADSIELYAAGGAALLALPFAILRIDRRRAEPEKAAVTMLVAPMLVVMPLPEPVPERVGDDDDIEGKTVRAPTAHEDAYEMHARYAPTFDQQAMIARYESAHGAEPLEAPQEDPASFDQQRYAQALQYADAFEAQLSEKRRTAAYSVAPPRRIARGSYTPQQYRSADTRSDQRAGFHDEPKTLVGVKPAK